MTTNIMVPGCIDPDCDCWGTNEMYVRGQVRRAIENLSVMAKMRVLHDVNLEVIQGFDD